MTDSLDLISFFAVLICLQTLFQLFQNWSNFWDDQITSKEQELAQRLALFILLPIGVLLHEIGHSVATWQVGGTVSEFQWRFYWGYIIPSGDFTAVEYWWIALSGNLVSIFLGLLSIPLIIYIRKRIVAEVLYYFACVELIYALVAYPLISWVLRIGDWVKIYDFTVQPYANVTLITHLVLLGTLWQLFHSDIAIRWRLSRNPHILAKWLKLQADAAHQSQDLELKLKLAYFWLRQEEIHEAKKVARQIAQIAPDNERVQVLQVAIDCFNRSYRQAIKSGQQLLNKNLSNEEQLRLYRLLCFCLWKTRQLKEALLIGNQGLIIAPQDYKLRCHRAMVYQALGQYQEARADLNVALENAPDFDSRQQLQQWLKNTGKLN